MDTNKDIIWGVKHISGDKVTIQGKDYVVVDFEIIPCIFRSDIRIDQVHETVFMRRTVKQREIQRANKKRRKKH